MAHTDLCDDASRTAIEIVHVSNVQGGSYATVYADSWGVYVDSENVYVYAEDFLIAS